jgi:hypothetical protein
MHDVQSPVMIKIFTDPVAFSNEEQAYGLSLVEEAVEVAPTFIDNADGGAVMPNGLPFPPFSISDKGEPLNVWLERCSIDPITSMQVQLPLTPLGL